VIVIEGSASAHKPQKVHLPKSKVAVRLASPSTQLSALVGQAWDPGRASFQLVKSMAGRPRPQPGPASGFAGNGLVTIPVLKLLLRISNIVSGPFRNRRG